MNEPSLPLPTQLSKSQSNKPLLTYLPDLLLIHLFFVLQLEREAADPAGQDARELCLGKALTDATPRPV